MELLTVQETARLLKVAPMTVRRYIADGRLPAVRVGRGIRIRSEAVEDLLSPVPPAVSRNGSEERHRHRRQTHAPEWIAVAPLTEEEKSGIIAAMKEAKRLRLALAAERGGPISPSSLELLDEVREQRSRERS